MVYSHRRQRPDVFVGHYAVAIVLIALVPGVDPVVALLGVGLPDLLLAVLVLAGIERVSRDADSPLWTAIDFEHYPYSHSLVVGTAIWAGMAVLLAILANPAAGAVLVVAAVSHWLLDVMVHDADLPVLGFGADWYVGAGLWRYPRTNFVVEFLLFVLATVLVLPAARWLPVLAVGAAFALMTANASFGFARTNPLYDAIATRIDPALGTSNPAIVETLFATHVIAGYVGMTAALWLVLGW